MLGEQPLTAVDVAGMLHVGRNKVYELAKSGELASYHMGRKLRFSRHDVEAFLQAQRSGNIAPAQGFADDADIEADYLYRMVREEPGFVLAGSESVTDVLASFLFAAECHVQVRHVNGFAALVGIYLGEVDMAVADLYDMGTNNFNIAYVQRLAPGVPVVVMNLLKRNRGFVVARGNPKGITTWGSLLKDGVHLAQQEPGSAGRVLLDQKLSGMEALGQNLQGYADEATGEYAAAERVMAGEADVAICSQRVADSLEDVSFVPMQAERVDLVVRKNAGTRGLLRTLKRLMASDELREAATGATGADCGRMGAIVYES